MSARIVVVDDERNVRRLLADVLGDEGYRVRGAADLRELEACLQEEGADLVLLDVCLPGRDGLSWLGQGREENPAVIMMSGHGTIDTALKAIRLGAIDFLEKPLQPDRLLLSVQNALQLGRLRRENARLREETEPSRELLGDSEAMRRLRDLVEKAAPTGATVLVCGENGTGKELVARALHRRSARGEGPFVRVNCAAIPANLLESELFGHEKGAFSGAVQRRRGHFEMAQGGTLLLDEIAEMDFALQAKLLRVLEEREITRVGGEHPLRLDVRVVASTNRDLPEQVRSGRFREDLFYRLDVLAIEVPPLRARGDDVVLLAGHFLRHFAAEHGRRWEGLTTGAETLLRRHRWPGNVRELRNAVERLVILGEGPRMREEDLRPLLGGRGPGAENPAGRSSAPGLSLREQLESTEREIIRRALEETGGNLAAAARCLGVDRGNLHRRLRRLGISRDDS